MENKIQTGEPEIIDITTGKPISGSELESYAKYTEIRMTRQEILKGYDGYVRVQTEVEKGVHREEEYISLYTPVMDVLKVVRKLPLNPKVQTKPAVGQFFQLCVGDTRNVLNKVETYLAEDGITINPVVPLKEQLANQNVTLTSDYLETRRELRIVEGLREMALGKPDEVLVFKCIENDLDGRLIAVGVVTEAYATIPTQYLKEQVENAMADVVADRQFFLIKEYETTRSQFYEWGLPNNQIKTQEGHSIGHVTIRFTDSGLGKDGMHLRAGFLVLECSNGLVIWDKDVCWSRKHVKAKNMDVLATSILDEFKFAVDIILKHAVNIAGVKMDQAMKLTLNRELTLLRLKELGQSDLMVKRIEAAWKDALGGNDEDTVWGLIMAMTWLPQKYPVEDKGSRKKDITKTVLTPTSVLSIQDFAGQVFADPKKMLTEKVLTV